MEPLYSKSVVVALAVVGALLSICASAFRATGRLSETQAKRLNVVAYAVMGVSMLLFALAGLRGVPG